MVFLKDMLFSWFFHAMKDNGQDKPSDAVVPANAFAALQLHPSCLRGGFTVDAEWKNSKVTTYRITAKEARPVQLRVNGAVKIVLAEKTARIATACP